MPENTKILVETISAIPDAIPGDVALLRLYNNILNLNLNILRKTGLHLLLL